MVSPSFCAQRGFEDPNARLQWGLARDGLTERTLYLRKAQMQTNPRRITLDPPPKKFGKEKVQPFGCGFVLALPIFPGRPSIVLPSASVQWTLAGRKKPRSFDRGFVLALPIFPGSRPPSIVGVHVLNFCVRDGNRWTLMTINTNL